MGVLVDVGIVSHTFEHEAPALVTENGLERVLQHLLVARHPKEHGLLVAENVETSTRLHDEDVHRVLLVAVFSVQADGVSTNCDSHGVSFQAHIPSHAGFLRTQTMVAVTSSPFLTDSTTYSSS